MIVKVCDSMVPQINLKLNKIKFNEKILTAFG